MNLVSCNTTRFEWNGCRTTNKIGEIMMSDGGGPMFERYVGIDYSGAQTPRTSLSGLRVYLAYPESPPEEVLPPPGPRKYWAPAAAWPSGWSNGSWKAPGP